MRKVAAIAAKTVRYTLFIGFDQKSFVIPVVSISEQFSKLDNNDIFIYMLSAGTDVAEHVAKFIYENLP